MSTDTLKVWPWTGQDLAEKREPIQVDAVTYVEARLKVAHRLRLPEDQVTVRALYEYELRKKAVAA